MAFPLISPFHQFFDSSGAPLVGGSLEFRDPTTNNLINSYATADDADAQTNANDNPLTLDARGGFAGIYLEDGVKYKVILKNAAGGTEDTQDDVRCPVFSDSAIGAQLYPTSAAETTASITPTNKNRELYPYDLRRVGIVPNDTGARTANTTAAISLFDPTVTGPVGNFIFPNITGADTYYFDDIIQLREGCHLDLNNCTLDFAKSYVAADDRMGFFTFIQNNSIVNGTISVAYDGSAGTNAGMVLRIGSRKDYPFGTHTGGIDDEDLTLPMGNITLRNLRITSNNPGPTYLALMLGGLENVIIENVTCDGQDVVESGFYYEFGYYHYEATVANRTTSHAHNMHFKNIVARNMKDDGTTGYPVNLVGAYNCTIDGITADVSYGGFMSRSGEALFYNVGAPYVTGLRRSNKVRNVVGKGITGIFISHDGAELASSGYLSTEGLTASEQTDLLHLDISGFSTASGSVGLASSGPITAKNGSIRNTSTEGVRLTDECVDFEFDRVDILDGTTAGIRGNFGSNIFTTPRKKVGSITHCKIAGNANNAIDIDHTQSVKIAYNRIGYDTLVDGVAETTQNIGVSVGTDGDGVICEGNTVQISGGSNAYQTSGTPDGCEIRNPRGVTTSSGVWGAAATATNIADVGHAINTVGKYIYKRVYDTSNKRVMVAQGSTAASAWISVADFGAGDAVVTVTPA